MEVFFQELARRDRELFLPLFFPPTRADCSTKSMENWIWFYFTRANIFTYGLVTTPLKCFGNCSASFPLPQPHWPLSVVTKKEKKWFSFLSFEQVAAGCLSNLSKIGFAVEMADFSRTHRREPIDGRPEQ